MQKTAGFDNHIKKTKGFKKTLIFDAITRPSVKVAV